MTTNFALTIHHTPKRHKFYHSEYFTLDSPNRGSHTFSIPASIIGEVPHASLLFGTCVWRSSHSPRINRSRSPPSTLENWASRSFLREVFILRLTEFTLWLLIPTALVFLHLRCLRLHYLGYTALLTSALLRVNPFSSFHSPCSPQQNGVSHILHAQGLPIGSLFLSPLSHSRRNLAP